MTTGFVCGFRAEARIAACISPLTACGWRNPDAARHLIDRGATALISFGVAGAPDPMLQPGDLLIPKQIVASESAPIDVSPDLHELLIRAFPAARQQPMAVTNTVIDTVLAKQRLFEATHAIAADMESEAVAKAALAAGIPFAVFRVISDPAGHALPPAALAGLNDAGDVDYAAVLLSLLANPLQLPALIRTGRQSSIALIALRQSLTVLKLIL